MKYIGIDPGCKGGICILDQYKIRNIMTISLEKVGLADVGSFFSGMRADDEKAIVYLENPSLPPTNLKRASGTGANVQGYTKLYRSLGQLEGICVAFGYIPELINPRTWQSRLDVLTKGDKNVTKNEAIKLFPFYAKREGVTRVTHDIADAMLIALLCYLDHTPSKYIIGEFKYARYKPLPISKRPRHNDSITSESEGDSISNRSSQKVRSKGSTLDLEQYFKNDS